MKKFLLLIVVFCFVGCALRHVSEIQRVQDYGRNTDEQQKYVQETNKKFEELVNVIKVNQISSYATQQDFLKAFGEPIFKRKSAGREDYTDMWLYRYCQKMYGSEKVYLYFDSGGRLVAWEYQPAEIR